MTAQDLRVVLADDQPLVLKGISAILNAQPALTVIGTATNGRDAVELVKENRPDVVCLDIEMPVMNGIEAAAEIRASVDTQVIMLTTFNREDYLLDALRAGASGFLLKTATPEQLAEGIRTAASGEALLAPEATRTLIRRAVAEHADSAAGPPSAPLPAQSEPGGESNTEPLSERECEVLAQAAEGLSNAEIASRLFIGAETVKTHMSRILSKLHLRNRIEAVVYAHRHGIILRLPLTACVISPMRGIRFLRQLDTLTETNQVH